MSEYVTRHSAKICKVCQVRSRCHQFQTKPDLKFPHFSQMATKWSSKNQPFYTVFSFAMFCCSVLARTMIFYRKIHGECPAPSVWRSCSVVAERARRNLWKGQVIGGFKAFEKSESQIGWKSHPIWRLEIWCLKIRKPWIWRLKKTTSSKLFTDDTGSPTNTPPGSKPDSSCDGNSTINSWS